MVANDEVTGRSVQRSFTVHADVAQARCAELVERFGMDGGRCSARERASTSPSCSSGFWPATATGGRRPARRTPRSPGSSPPILSAAPGSRRSPRRRGSVQPVATTGRLVGRWCGDGGQFSAPRCRGRSPSGSFERTRWTPCEHRQGRSRASTSSQGGRDPAVDGRRPGHRGGAAAGGAADGWSRAGGVVRRRADPTTRAPCGRHRRPARRAGDPPPHRPLRPRAHDRAQLVA